MTIKLLVDNEFGVLTRITALVRREGFNVKSLAVEVTANPEESLMLIAFECYEAALPKLLVRLNKLDSVKFAEKVDDRFDLGKELQDVFSHLVETEKDGEGYVK